MNLSRPFITRPIATTLLTLGLALAGLAAYFVLPVARLPNVNQPVITVSASLAGASPADMARTVAMPLERTLGVIAGVTEMTSSSEPGSTRMTLMFEQSRDIDSAARDVQAAINAARADLPATLRAMPAWRKRNPSAQPFMILALSSATRSPGQIYDVVSNLVSQRLLQVPGVGDVELGGGSLPAVRVALNPFALDALGMSSEDVRAAIQAGTANRPKGVLETDAGEGSGAAQGRALQIVTPAPGLKAADWRDLIVAVRNGAGVRLSDVAQVSDSVQNTRTRGMFNGQAAIIVSITQEPGANLIATADAIHALLPQLRAQLPGDIALNVANDRTATIRSSVHEVELTLALAVLLVVGVVGLFLRNLRAALIPAAATVVSLLGTFGAMHVLGYSLNYLTLMALTVATGFVVDDAIVVLENISRHLEEGMPRRQAALRGAREVGFTVLTISASLIAVFIPLLFMSGFIGLMFREFAVTLSIAVLISLLVSLTTTPMMCAALLPRSLARPAAAPQRQSLLGRLRQRVAGAAVAAYLKALDGALAAPWLAVLALAAVIGMSGWMFAHMARGFFPEQDSRQMQGHMRADQSISSSLLADKIQQAVDIVRADPAVGDVVAFSGGGRAGGGFLAATLKPASEAPESSRAVINRLRPQLAQITGLSVFMNLEQEVRMSARSSNSGTLYVLKSDSAASLREWTLKLAAQLKTDPRLTDVDESQSDNGVETFITVHRDRATQYGVSSSALNAALYNAFGQRQIATLYADLNQYAIVMEWLPRLAQSPLALQDVRAPSSFSASASAPANPGLRDASTGQSLSTSARTLVPLTSFASYAERAVPTSVQHDGGELSSTLSFNLADGVSLQAAQEAVREAENAIGMPNSVRGQFAGNAAQMQQQQSEQMWLVIAAVVVIYLVLGILYESLIHPLTVLTTLPSAGFGAVLALLAMKMEFTIMALIGVFLLIGIVKKNAILVIDFALSAERERGLDARSAVREACLKRLRPILMTTLAAGLGALPLAIGFGQGAELRQPLGVTIIGGLLASQFMTLLTTPAIYVLLDGLRQRIHRPCAERMQWPDSQRHSAPWHSGS